LIRQDLGDELLVYDPESARTHALSEVSSVVFDCCDGTRSAAAIEGILAERTGLAPDRAAVEVALADLHAAGLITWEGAEPPVGMSEQSRRDALRKIGMAAGTAVGAPLVYSIIAPTVAAAQSDGGGGGGGGGGGSCPLGTGNLLRNPSFEDSLPGGWTSNGAGRLTYPFVGLGNTVNQPSGSSGSYCAYLLPYGAYFYQDVDVSAAASQIDSAMAAYDASGWIRALYLNSGTSTYSSLPANLSLEFYDGSNTLIGSPVVVGTAPSPPSGGPPSDWLLATGTGPVPATTRKVRLHFAGTGGISGSPFFAVADELSLKFTCWGRALHPRSCRP